MALQVYRIIIYTLREEDNSRLCTILTTRPSSIDCPPSIKYPVLIHYADLYGCKTQHLNVNTQFRHCLCFDGNISYQQIFARTSFWPAEAQYLYIFFNKGRNLTRTNDVPWHLDGGDQCMDQASIHDRQPKDRTTTRTRTITILHPDDVSLFAEACLKGFVVTKLCPSGSTRFVREGGNQS